MSQICGAQGAICWRRYAFPGHREIWTVGDVKTGGFEQEKRPEFQKCPLLKVATGSAKTGRWNRKYGSRWRKL
jgi:hypothetical protein